MTKMKPFPRVLKKWHPLVHRVYLFLKPAYWRLRTPAQKRFDTRLQFIFVGCCVAVLLAAFIIPAANRLMTYSVTDTYDADMDIPVEPQEEPQPELPQTPEEELLLNIQTGKITQVDLTLKKNETLSGLLTRGGLPMAEALKTAKALGLVTDVRLLRPNQVFELFFGADNTFYGLKMESRQGEMISVFKNIDGAFVPQAREGKVESKLIKAQGIIESSFAKAAEATDIPKAIAHQVSQALDGEIDFRTDIKTGTPFMIVYEKKMTETGREIGKSILLYVSLQANGQTYNRYYFVDAAGNPSFYNERGESTPKTLMKRPLGRGRISSPFGSRLHPILKYQIHHSGVDFPAPTGTPIPAGADGVIVQMGRFGAYGKYIRVKHTDTYSTAYGHMSGYNKDLRVGSYVKRGDTIGYVGSTGRSTGPHLHYEVIKNGKQVNPLNTYTIPKRTLKNQSLQAFIKAAKRINPDYVFPSKD